ncbi:hypothetical protein E3U23_10415 [Erythrobacter litoralis]|uniref:hypothetical protein n=1 Tax=Erythrobacter litoralis TaxID=39960 RepID=UPI0024351D25|nr:hypothetical protein [Erythrobacter litoralis]MDG6079608.1 hypothetical protein [Erythrobacter litoralis]
MPNPLAFLASLALLVPTGIAPSDRTVSPEDRQVLRQSRPAKPPVVALPLSDRAPGWTPLLEPAQPRTEQQVRIERRVIIRISPMSGTMRSSFLPEQPRPRSRPPQFVERPHPDCIESATIAAVSTRGNRLLILTRDRRMVTAKLENGCSPRDFYQGFYMERSKDGKLCVKRDKLLSRSGAKCEVEKLHNLVEVTPL